MTMLIKAVNPTNAKAAIKVHYAAVRDAAFKDCSADILEQWAPLPVNDGAVTNFIENADGKVRFLAEQAGKIVGMAAMVPSNCELRSCYVAPEAGGQGVGTALLRELEKEADRRGLPFLQLDSSLTAERPGNREKEVEPSSLPSGPVLMPKIATLDGQAQAAAVRPHLHPPRRGA